MTDDTTVADRLAVVDATVRLFWHADRREWNELLDDLAEHVELDYTSLNGGEPATLRRDDVVAGWTELLGSLDATQHLVSNHLVSVQGDRATCTAAFQATHVLANPHGGPVWTLGGHYDFRLLRQSGAWRIASIRMTADWATGNQQIMNLAPGQRS